MIKRIIDKLLSARFLIALFCPVTYCYILKRCVYLVEIGKMQVETFIALMGGFLPLIILIVEWYYKREDRNKKGDSNGSN